MNRGGTNDKRHRTLPSSSHIFSLVLPVTRKRVRLKADPPSARLSCRNPQGFIGTGEDTSRVEEGGGVHAPTRRSNSRQHSHTPRSRRTKHDRLSSSRPMYQSIHSFILPPPPATLKYRKKTDPVRDSSLHPILLSRLQSCTLSATSNSRTPTTSETRNSTECREPNLRQTRALCGKTVASGWRTVGMT